MAGAAEETTAEATTTYDVVMNDEEQYSIWPAALPSPDGWRAAGFRGSKQACLSHIDEVWTDMRPRTLREAMGR
ncbi:MbtH family NRPS accessory protein [Actinomadura fulvescens]|uniref:MbtH family NRPS accessory protein n=1 Tax=Actinomadura fulvescens TaxID=46160 RepID=A0ABN3QTQ6_9ACTN